MAGTKISEATLRSTLKGTEQIPLVDTDLPKGKTTAANLKTYCTPDLSGYAKKTEIPSIDGLLSKTEADGYYQAKGSYATTTQLGTKLDTSAYNSDKATFATKSEVNAKLSGTGVTSVQVVTELPSSPSETTMYVVVPSDEESNL